MTDQHSTVTMQFTRLPEWGAQNQDPRETITVENPAEFVVTARDHLNTARRDMEAICLELESVSANPTPEMVAIQALYAKARQAGTQLFDLCRDHRPMFNAQTMALARSISNHCHQFGSRGWLLVAGKAQNITDKQTAFDQANRRLQAAATFTEISFATLEKRQRRHDAEIALRASNMAREKAQLDQDIAELLRGQEELENQRHEEQENREPKAARTRREGTVQPLQESAIPSISLHEDDDLTDVDDPIPRSIAVIPSPASVIREPHSQAHSTRSTSIALRGPPPRKRKSPPPPDSGGSGQSDGDRESDRQRRFERFLEFERREKESKRRRKHRRRYSRSHSPAPQRITLSKPKMIQPEKFSGSRKEDFRVWFRTVEDYLEYSSGQFSNDIQKVIWLGSFLTGKAQIWFQDRRTKLLEERWVDDWRGFRKALKDRFIDPYEDFQADLELEQLEYKDDVSHYLAQFRVLNHRVHLSGVALRNRIFRQIPRRIQERMSMFGPDPEDDEDFLDRVEECGRKDEHFARQQKMLSRGRTEFRAEERKESKVRQTQKATARAEGSGSQKKREIVHPDRTTALKGIPESLIKSRESRALCLRCGMNNHQFRFCLKPINPNSTNPKKVAALSKKRRSRDDGSDSEDGEDSERHKKAKRSSPKVPTGRVYEVDTEDEEGN